MKRSEAITLIRQIQAASQKARSNINEELPWLPESMKLDLMPYLHGRNGLNLVEICQKTLEHADTIEGINLYNILLLANKEAVVGMVLALRGIDLPKASPQFAAMEFEGEF